MGEVEVIPIKVAGLKKTGTNPQIVVIPPTYPILRLVTKRVLSTPLNSRFSS